jgi:hypothetical protein
MFYWILLKVVDLSHLNHPNEFAAVTFHQKHILSAIYKVLISTQKTGTLSLGQQQEIKSAPQARLLVLGGRGKATHAGKSGRKISLPSS